MTELWIPPIKQIPDERKPEGGSYFDDEMQNKQEIATHLGNQVRELLLHLNERPDHVVYVGSTEKRTEMRTVFNSWNQQGALSHNPDIRIDYGVPDNQIRVGD